MDWGAIASAVGTTVALGLALAGWVRSEVQTIRREAGEIATRVRDTADAAERDRRKIDYAQDAALSALNARIGIAEVELANARGQHVDATRRLEERIDALSADVKTLNASIGGIHGDLTRGFGTLGDIIASRITAAMRRPHSRDEEG